MIFKIALMEVFTISLQAFHLIPIEIKPSILWGSMPLSLEDPGIEAKQLILVQPAILSLDGQLNLSFVGKVIYSFLGQILRYQMNTLDPVAYQTLNLNQN